MGLRCLRRGGGFDDPGCCGVAVGALAARVVVRTGMAGVTVGVAGVIKVGVSPTVRCVAGGAVAGPMAGRRGVTAVTGVDVGVAKQGVVPLVGGVAEGAVAGPMVIGNGVARRTVGQVGVAESDLPPLAGDVAGGAVAAIVGDGGVGGVAGGAVAGGVVLVAGQAPTIGGVAGGTGGGVMVGRRLVAVATGFCAGICRMVKPGISPTILVVAGTTLPFMMPGRGVRQVALPAISITAVVKVYFLPGVAVLTICAGALVMSRRRLKVLNTSKVWYQVME